MEKQAKNPAPKDVRVTVLATNIKLSVGKVAKGGTAKIPAKEAETIVDGDKAAGRKARIAIK